MDDQQNMMVFIDHQNQPVDPEVVVKALGRHGRVVGGRAYGWWSDQPVLAQSYYRARLEMVSMPENGLPNNKRNDVKMLVDVMDALFMNKSVEIFALVTGDVDFLPLVDKLRERGKKTMVVARTPVVSTMLRQAADVFLPYESLVKAEKLPGPQGDMEDLVTEVARTLAELGLKGAFEDCLRVLAGMKINPTSYGMEHMTELATTVSQHLAHRRKKAVESGRNAADAALDEGLLRFSWRVLLELGPVSRSTLVSALEGRHPFPGGGAGWGPFVDRALQEKMLLKTGTQVDLPLERKWEIGGAKVSPQPDLFDKSATQAVALLKSGRVATLMELGNALQNVLGISGAAANALVWPMKFSGAFVGIDGSDYVSFGVPVRCTVDAPELARRMALFFVKQCLRIAPAPKESLPALAAFVLGSPEKLGTLKELLDSLVASEDVECCEGAYVCRSSKNGVPHDEGSWS